MRALTLAAALSLAGCAHAHGIPTTVPPSSLVDDKLGVAVETAYQAASLAERTAAQAGLLSPDEAGRLLVLDQQAYTYVCYTRTAYDIANGLDPTKRLDACPSSTKAGTDITYVQAAQSALALTQQLLAAIPLGIKVGSNCTATIEVTKTHEPIADICDGQLVAPAIKGERA